MSSPFHQQFSAKSPLNQKDPNGPKTKKLTKKPLGKKSDNDSPETEARRVKEYKIAKAQKEAENKKAKEKGKASKANYDARNK